MSIYYFLIIMWFILAFIYICITQNASDTFKDKIQKNFAFIMCALLFFVCGFRAYSWNNYIGIDTYSYSCSYEKALNISSFSSLLQKEEFDIGYYIFNWILGIFDCPFSVLLIIESLVYVGATFLFIRKYAKNPMLSILIFVCLGLYTFSFSTIRQSFAMGICLIAYMVYDSIKGKKAIIYFILLTILASTFHASAIVFLPVVFISKLKYNKKTVAIFAFIALMTMLFSSKFTPFILRMSNIISEKYNSYVDTGEFVGKSLYIFITAFLLLRIFFTKKIAKKEKNDNFIYMLLTMLIIFPAVQSGGAMMRIYYYYYMFAPVCISNTISDISDKKFKIVLQLAMIAFCVFFFFNNTDFEVLRLTPYHFSFNTF